MNRRKFIGWAAVSAAVQAKRMGKSCVVVSPETRIGGLPTGGLDERYR